jgi:hypothetical protein
MDYSIWIMDLINLSQVELISVLCKYELVSIICQYILIFALFVKQNKNVLYNNN